MLGIGRIPVRDCRGWTRRELLRAGTLSAVGLGLPDLLRLEAAERTEKALRSSPVPIAVEPPTVFRP